MNENVEYTRLSEIDFKKYEGQQIAVAARIVKVEERKSRNNTTYLTIDLCDKETTFSIKIFDTTPDTLLQFKVGGVYGFIGIVGTWNKKPQLNLLYFVELECNPDLFKNPEVDVSPYLDTINKVFHTMHPDSVYYKISNAIYTTYLAEIKRSPAAKSHHHVRPGELLMHTATMLRSAARIYEIYKANLNWDLLASGIILHDIGKIYEYEVTDEEQIEYTTTGALLGHISLMLQEIAKTAEKLHIPKCLEIDLLSNAIASHHGKLEYGSPVLPCTLEARVINHLDMLDAEAYRASKLLSPVKGGELVSVKVGQVYETYVKVPEIRDDITII